MQDGLLDWTDVRAHFEHVMYSELALTQTEVATRGGIPQEYVSRVLLNHKDGPKAQTLIRALQGLGIPLAQFFAELDAAAAASRAQSASVPAPSAPVPRDEEPATNAEVSPVAVSAPSEGTSFATSAIAALVAKFSESLQAIVALEEQRRTERGNGARAMSPEVSEPRVRAGRRR
jgi:transcriptional regulator with XRE-family HTH domain